MRVGPPPTEKDNWYDLRNWCNSLYDDLLWFGVGDRKNTEYLSQHDSFELAITALGTTDDARLFIDKDVTMTGNVTVSGNIYLQFGPGKLIDPNGYTLTVHSPSNIIARPSQKIFEESVTFTRGGTAHVGWWGATGDGSTDDSTPIQNAVTSAAGILLKFLPGRTYITDQTSISSNTVIDLNSATVKMKSGTVGNIFVVTSTTDVRIQGPGVLDGQRTTQSGTNIDTNCAIYGDTSVVNLTVSGLRIRDTHSSGIRLKDATYVLVENNYIHNCGYTSGTNPDTGAGTTPAAVNVRETSGFIKILGNTIIDNWFGVRFEDEAFYDVVISQNEIRGNMRGGVGFNSSAGDSSRVNVNDNVFHSNGDDAVWLYGVNFSSIIGNTIQSWISGGNSAGYGGGYGVELRDCEGVTIDNSIQTVGTTGVTLRGCKFCTVRGTVIDAQSHGVSVIDSTGDGNGTHSEDINISGMVITGCEANGIRISYGDYVSINGNILKDNGEGGSTTGGIYMTYATYSHIVANRVRKGGATQEPGIEEDTGSDYNVIESNFVSGHTTEISTVGANTITQNNTITL